MRKSIFALVLVFVLVAAIFTGCSRLPKEPAVDSSQNQTYINPDGATVTAQDANDKNKIVVEHVQTLDGIELKEKSYYVFGKNAAEMTFKKISYDGVQVNASGFVDVKMIAIGKRSDDMKIGYTAYDAEGNDVLQSYIYIKLKGVKKGDVVENRRFYFPTDAVRVEFYDYTEIV